jgi:hypothetical protein
MVAVFARLAPPWFKCVKHFHRLITDTHQITWFQVSLCGAEKHLVLDSKIPELRTPTAHTWTHG